MKDSATMHTGSRRPPFTLRDAGVGGPARVTSKRRQEMRIAHKKIILHRMLA